MGLSVQWTVWEDRKVLELGGAAGSALVHVTELCPYNGTEDCVACISYTFNNITQNCLLPPSGSCITVLPFPMHHPLREYIIGPLYLGNPVLNVAVPTKYCILGPWSSVERSKVGSISRESPCDDFPTTAGPRPRVPSVRYLPSCWPLAASSSDGTSHPSGDVCREVCRSSAQKEPNHTGPSPEGCSKLYT